jgi:hypothetical protein
MKKVFHLKLVNGNYQNGISKGFEQAGYEAHECDYGKLLRNAGLLGCWQRIYTQCQSIQPDIIFIHCNRDGFIFPEEAKELSKYAFTILYCFDVRIENSWIYDVAPYLDLVCMSNYDDVEKLKAKGYNAAYLGVSADFDFYKPTELPKRNYGDIVFIGNNYIHSDVDFELCQQRLELINFMVVNFGGRFRCYGRGWIGSEVLNPEQERDAYNSAKIAITHNHFNRKGYHSDRDMRAMGSGVFTICQHYEYIDSHFYSWNSLSKLKKLCSSVLANDYLRIKKAAEVREYVLKNYSWANKIKQLQHLISEKTVERI